MIGRRTALIAAFGGARLDATSDERDSDLGHGLAFDNPRNFAALDQKLRGSVVIPGDDRWDEARTAWALAVDQRPAAVAFPEGAGDVASIVKFARAAGLRVAAQGTGHNAHLLEGALANTVLVKTSRMREVEIDPARRRAQVAAGAIWTDVTLPAAEHGLAALAGSSPDVGVVGYTLGGGLSWLSRRHGLAANSVTAIQVVTADGHITLADRDRNPDLFWALRGGGGSFGIVTAIELELLPIREVYAGAMFWPQERAAEVLNAWREWTHGELPDEINSVGRVINFPPLPDVPEAVRGGSFVVVEAYYIGDETDGADLVAPLRALEPAIDTLQMVPAPALCHIHMDPEHPVPGKGDGMLLDDAPARAIDALVAAACPESGSVLLSAELRQLGGALARPRPTDGALASLDAGYAMYAVGAIMTPEMRPAIEAQVSRVKQALGPWAAAQSYLNFAERPVGVESLYGHRYAYRRLQQVKASYDPDDMFQSNHPIPPAGVHDVEWAAPTRVSAV